MVCRWSSAVFRLEGGAQETNDSAKQRQLCPTSPRPLPTYDQPHIHEQIVRRNKNKFSPFLEEQLKVHVSCRWWPILSCSVFVCVLTAEMKYQCYRKFGKCYFLSHNPMTITQLSSVFSLITRTVMVTKYTHFWMHRFCFNIILYVLMFLKMPYHHHGDCLRIHQLNEPILIMSPFRDFKIFPILATVSDELCLLKWKF